MKTRSMGDVLDRYKGFGPGFDFARVFLAINVLAWHSLLLTLGSYGSAMNGGGWVLNYAILPMFFGLSGFLVAGSAQRQNLANFVVNRALRILPALIVEIVLSAIVIGPIFTVFNLKTYFTDHHFYTYFLNIVGFVHFILPGVFLSNPFPAVVNGSLWTVPFEMMCYIVMAFLIVTGIIKNAWLTVLMAVVVVGASTVFQFASAAVPHAPIFAHLLALYLHDGKGPPLLPCFILGAATYTWRYRIPFDWRILAACVIAMAGFGIFGKSQWWEFTPTTLIICPLMIYIVIYIGLIRMPPLPYYSKGDYSYGIYLYAFPIQQVLVVLFPSIRGWPLHVAISLAATTIFATFSWHVIEKPILRLRKNFSFVNRLEQERAAAAKQAEIDIVRYSPPPTL